MMRTLAAACMFLSLGAFAQKNGAGRPKITAIDHVVFYTTSAETNQHLYEEVFGLAKAEGMESGQAQSYWVGKQWVGYSPAPDAKSMNRMDHVALLTEDCEALRKYLAANGIAVPSSVSKLKDGSRVFSVQDPDGHRIEFLQLKKARTISTSGTKDKDDPISRRIIHAGFVVKDRAAADHFYKDILGFHLYWYGGMQNDRADWVAMQLPDGTDWLEYMLNIRADADQRLIGVMNHVSLGVKDIKAAQAKLESRGWKPNDREHSQLGRDGKWQLNMYDPDLTRVELMEFTPAEKPCCSEFQGQHPSEP